MRNSLDQPEPPTLRIKPLRPGVSIPAYQTTLAAGLDVGACLDAPVTIEPGEIRLIPCGFAMSLPPGWEGQVRPRSGLASRFGITLPNAPGTIDADYRGEVMVALINLGREPFEIRPGMRIAQMVICPVARAVVVETDRLDPKEGEGPGAPGAGVEVRGLATPRVAGAPGGGGAGSRTRGAGGFGSTGL